MKELKFFNDRGCCQTIGYHLAQRTDFLSERSPSSPRLAVVICQFNLCFIFFPSYHPLKHNAIISGSIELFNGPLISESWFVSTCLCIGSIFKSELRLIQEGETNKEFHLKKVYSVQIETDLDEKDTLLK